jgi:hypothetical protein
MIIIYAYRKSDDRNGFQQFLPQCESQCRYTLEFVYIRNMEALFILVTDSMGGCVWILGEREPLCRLGESGGLARQ